MQKNFLETTSAQYLEKHIQLLKLIKNIKQEYLHHFEYENIGYFCIHGYLTCNKKYLGHAHVLKSAYDPVKTHLSGISEVAKLNNVEAYMISYCLKCSPDTVPQIK